MCHTQVCCKRGEEVIDDGRGLSRHEAIGSVGTHCKCLHTASKVHCYAMVHVSGWGRAAVLGGWVPERAASPG